MTIMHTGDSRCVSELAMAQCVRCPRDGDIHLVTVRLAAYSFAVRGVMCQEARRLCRNNCQCTGELNARFKAA